MSLKDIVSITGKGGLHEVVAKSQKGVVVRSIEDPQKKFMVNANHQIAMLDEITIYSNDLDDLHLSTVMKNIKEKYGNELPVKPKSSGKELKEFFNEVAPNHDEDRVYTSDIKKIVKWYNLLKDKNYLNELEEESNDSEEKGNEGEEE